jgi:hypothetical protein
LININEIEDDCDNEDIQEINEIEDDCDNEDIQEHNDVSIDINEVGSIPLTFDSNFALMDTEELNAYIQPK